MRVLAYCGFLVAMAGLDNLHHDFCKRPGWIHAALRRQGLRRVDDDPPRREGPGQAEPGPENRLDGAGRIDPLRGTPNGYIVTEKEYGELRPAAEVALPGRRQGRQQRRAAPRPGDTTKDWPTSVEAQLAAGSAGDFWLIYPPKATLEVEKSRQDPKQARHYFRIGGKDKKVEKDIRRVEPVRDHLPGRQRHAARQRRRSTRGRTGT